MSLLESTVLAGLQGLTEFLPISSSGHLVIARALFGWSDDGGLVFDTLLHAGSLAAILSYFWRDWLAVARGYLNPRHPDFTWYRRLPWLLAVATLPVVAAGPLLKPFLESEASARNLSGVGLSMLATALFFWLCERRRRRAGDRPAAGPSGSGPGFLDAFLIGCLQVVALLPGASRSGWTVGGGLLRGQPRETAVRFAFFMALPAIAGAIVFQTREILQGPVAGIAPLQAWVGFGVSFLVSLGAIHFCLKFFRTHSLGGFAVYLAAAGALAVLAGLTGVVSW